MHISTTTGYESPGIHVEKMLCVFCMCFCLHRNYMNDCLRTNVFVRFQAETIACACIYLAARALQVGCSCILHFLRPLFALLVVF